MSGDIPRAEVERLLQAVRDAKENAVANQNFDKACGLRDAMDLVAALLKPKQYVVEGFFYALENDTIRFSQNYSDPRFCEIDGLRIVSVKPYTGTLKHGEGVQDER